MIILRYNYINIYYIVSKMYVNIKFKYLIKTNGQNKQSKNKCLLLIMVCSIILTIHIKFLGGQSMTKYYVADKSKPGYVCGIIHDYIPFDLRDTPEEQASYKNKNDAQELANELNILDNTNDYYVIEL